MVSIFVFLSTCVLRSLLLLFPEMKVKYKTSTCYIAIFCFREKLINHTAIVDSKSKTVSQSRHMSSYDASMKWIYNFVLILLFTISIVLGSFQPKGLARVFFIQCSQHVGLEKAQRRNLCLIKLTAL